MSSTMLRTPHATVAPNAIPSALRAIWRECCSGESEGNVSRSLTTNLIVVVDAARETELRQLLDVLSARQPSRAFLATIQPGNGAIEAQVHAAARVSARTRDIVLEQIELRVPEGSFAQLAGVVRPLLVNDIPTHCYWATAWPRDARGFDALAAVADHTIVDSARFQLPASELDAVEQRRRDGTKVTDLTWMRLRPWRRALAEVFERTPFRMFTPTEITVRHGDAGLAAAALLGRWLEQRLGARIALEASDGPTDFLAGAELRHGDAVATATLTSAGRIEVEVQTPAACFLPFAVPSSRGSEGDLLAAAIDLA